MKSRIAALFLLVAKAAGISSHAQADAQVWISKHPDSKPDDLAELKDQNPEAYALVNALLTKRSLGLLDPRHPTASFAAATVREDNVPGAEAFAKLATTPAEKQALQADSNPSPHSSTVELPFPDAQPRSHDWLNWKPPSGGMDDESMVRNVLGAVADLTKGKQLRGQQQSEDASPFNAAVEAEASKQEEQTTTLATTAAPVVLSVATEAHQNSYLKDYDLAPPPKHQQQQSFGENALASFTWDDASKVQATTTKAMQGSKQNMLASWLGIKPHVQTAAPVPEQKLSNPYLADLQ